MCNLYEVIKHKITFPDDPRALLEDPVFRQDKAQLYELIREFMTPTLIVNRPSEDCAMDVSTLKKIYNFCKLNYEVHPIHGAGSWHIKGSFTTSNRGVVRAFTISESSEKDAINVQSLGAAFCARLSTSEDICKYYRKKYSFSNFNDYFHDTCVICFFLIIVLGN